MRILTTLLCFTLVLGLAIGQAEGVAAPQGGTADGYDLTTGAGGSLDAADKSVAWGTNLSIRLDDSGASVTGQPIFLAAEILEAGLPLGVPCIDLDGDPLTCEANLSTNLFLLIDPTAGPLAVGQPASGLEVALNIPANAALWGAPTTTFRLQGAALNPASPIGVSVSNFIDHLVGEYTYAGPATDDGFVEIPLENGFPFYGTTYTSVYVNSNGNLTFGAGNGDFNPTEAEFLADEPRIAPLFSDISPNIAGSVDASVLRDGAGDLVSATIHYVGVPGFGGAGDNTLSAVLNADGSIDLAVTSVDQTSVAIAGISPGGDLSLANEIDLNDNAGFSGAPFQAIYETFDGSACGEFASDLVGISSTFVPTGTDSYDYLSAGATVTAVTGLSPAQGSDAGGDVVTITGSGFDLTGTYSVDFGGNAATGVTVLDACTIECTTPAGAPGFVDVTVSELGVFSLTLVGAFEYQPAGVATGSFSLSDDGSANYTFAFGGFTFYGVNYTDVWVNANGNLTFGSSDSDFSETDTEMLSDQPRIAQAWDDHNPPGGGSVDYTETTTSFSVTFSNVSAYTTGDNTHTVTLDKTTGAISMSYGTCTSWNGAVSTNDVLVGISAGGGLGVNTVIDVNNPGSALAALPEDALFEWLNAGGNAWALDGQSITFTPTGGVGVGPYSFSNP